MNSNTNNCLIFNALAFSGMPIDPADIELLTNVRSETDPDTVPNYYLRAEKIVSRIKDIKGHTIQTWRYYKARYIDAVISDLRIGQNIEAMNKLQAALISIETELNVELWIGGVGADTYIPGCQKQIKDVTINDNCAVLLSNLNESLQVPVVGITASRQSLVTLVSVGGIRLTCSHVTPMTLEFGTTCLARDALNKNIPVMDNGDIRWEKCVEVINNGLGFVYNLETTPYSACYAAGDESNRYIFTQRLSVIVEV